VCSVDGRIILYNNAAKQLLKQEQAGLVGLGRSVFGVLDRALIGHALEDIRHRLSEGDPQPVANMITTSKGGQLIRMQMAPVLSRVEASRVEESKAEAPALTDGQGADRGQEISGFVLTLEDVTRSVETSNRRDVLLQSLTENTRAALANMRAAVENMLAYPDMKPERRKQFTGIISEEARKLSGQLDQTLAEFSAYIKTRLPIESMLATDLISAIARRIETRLGISAVIEKIDPQLWLKVDSYSMAQAITYLASRLKDESQVRQIRFIAGQSGRLANLDMSWLGSPLASDTVAVWENDSFKRGGEDSPLKLKEVLERHDAEMLYQHDNSSSLFRVLLPAAEAGAALGKPSAMESRPEYYDFDLFNQPGQTAELDERMLTDLTYTVFDTETTGLEPSNGDEIISIGAVRVVNGRMLQHEVFEQLIDPQRSLPKASTAVHGITPEMLRGQPKISEVLPKFFQFCEDTVLVAHNAAFDMRFLQLKEEKTGVKFTQPVLDTLLLSPVVHPFDPAHKLEAMAERLGINVIGRHTALGDAFVTGEVFLRMVPVLAEKGVRTLKQAREASQKTLYAKVTY
ncbi:MAG: exonuclease domain-containing protein, partial [Pyrinomonadaceae bacterium]